MSLKKKRILSIVVLILILIEVSTIFLMYKSLNINVNNKSIKLNEQNKNIFAILLEKEDGTYEETDNWPINGYIYDHDKSGCTDKDGNILSNVLSFNDDTNVATVNTNDTTYCYLYFSKLCKIADDSTVEAGLEGAKYNCKVDPNKPEYTFYLLDNNEDGTSDLIMNANINASREAVIPGVTSDTGTVAWLSKERYDSLGGADLSNDGGACQYGGICSSSLYGPVTALEYLHNATKNWTNVEPLSYTYNDRTTQGITSTDIGYQSFTSTNGVATITAGDSEGTQVTIGSSSEPLRARMPIRSSDASITEVADKTDTNTNAFLYENISTSIPAGYWTMSSYAGTSSSSSPWFVDYNGRVVNYGRIDFAISRGVRPVITVEL